MMNDIDDSRLSHSHLTYLSHSHLTYCRFDGLELYLTNSLIALCHTMLAGDVTDSVIYSSVPEQLKVQQLEAPDDLDLDDDAFAPADTPPVGGPEDDGGVNADLGADTFGVAAEAPPAAESPSLNRVVAVAKVGGASAWFNQDCYITPPAFGRSGKGGKGGSSSYFRSVAADVGATVFYGESWVKSIRRREVQAHWYFVTPGGLILATVKNTCAEFNQGQCVRRSCGKFHAALGDLLDVLPNCRTRSPTVISKVDKNQAGSSCLYLEGGGLLPAQVVCGGSGTDRRI
jgi:hypothetical protein